MEDGPPDPQFTGVYWKPDAGDLISVVGYKLSATSVLEVADQVRFTPPGVVTCPSSRPFRSTATKPLLGAGT